MGWEPHGVGGAKKLFFFSKILKMKWKKIRVLFFFLCSTCENRQCFRVWKKENRVLNEKIYPEFEFKKILEKNFSSVVVVGVQLNHVCKQHRVWVFKSVGFTNGCSVYTKAENERKYHTWLRISPIPLLRLLFLPIIRQSGLMRKTASRSRPTSIRQSPTGRHSIPFGFSDDSDSVDWCLIPSSEQLDQSIYRAAFRAAELE